MRQSLTWRVVDGEALIVDLQTGDYFSLNPIATHMWERLQAGQPPDAIAADIAGQYGIDVGAVSADVRELLAELRDAKLWIEA